MSRPGDRHKTPRQYGSGAKKRKLSNEKHLKQQEDAKKSGNIFDFLTRTSSVATVGESSEADDKPSSSLESLLAKIESDPVPEVNCSDGTVTAKGVDIVMDAGSDDVDVNTDATRTSLNHGCNNDIGLWPAKCTSAMIDFWSSKDTNSKARKVSIS